MNNSIKAYKQTCKILGVKPSKIDPNIIIPDDTTLVIVPDQVFTWTKIKKLAVEFGKDQPYQTYIYESLYKQYSKEELSGIPTGQDYRIVFIPKKYNVDSSTAKEQKETHSSDHVPSVLEAVCFWFALREAEQKLDFTTTYIRHFDLEPKSIDDWLYVPYSYVDVDGKPYLYYSIADRRSVARVAVGSNSTLAPSTVSLPLELEINGEKYVKA